MPDANAPGMSRRYLSPSGLDTAGAKTALYGHGVRASGTFVLIAGQVARDGAGNLVGRDDPQAQAAQVYENLRRAVEDAGGAMSDIISTRTYVTDRAYRAVIADVRRRYFPGPDYPCNTFLVVAGLAAPEFLIEIEAVAHLDD